MKKESQLHLDLDSSQDELAKPKQNSRRYIGILLTLISSVAFSLGSLTVKLLPNYHPFNIGVWRFQGVFLLTLPILLYSWLVNGTLVFDAVLPPCSGKGRKSSFLLCCRWFFGCTAIILQYLSLQYISLADSLIITFSTPIFVTVVAHKFLNEKCGFVPLFIAFMTIVGVGIMSRPPILTGKEEFDWNAGIGIAYAVGSMACTGISFVLMRYLREVHFSFVVTFFGLWGTLECLILSFVIGTPVLPEGNDWVLAVGLAVLSLIGQLTLTIGLKFEQASIVSVLRTCDVLFGFVWQFLFLSTVPDVYSIIGAAIVVFGVILIGFRKWVSQLPEDHGVRSRCCLILS